MSIQEVRGKNSIPEYQCAKKAEHSEGFQESLIQNLKYQDQGRDSIQTDGKDAGKAKKQENAGLLGTLSGIRVSSVALTEALQTAKVRHMSYEESDNVKIAVVDGYTLKGKILSAEKGNACGQQPEQDGAQVYVEAKYEDGSLKAYQVDTAKVSDRTEHMIERFALETLESVQA